MLRLIWKFCIILIIAMISQEVYASDANIVISSCEEYYKIKATKDGNGNNISSTYVTKTGVEDITNKTISERANMGIGFAFQQPVRFKGITVGDLLELSVGRKVKLSENCDILSSVGLCSKDYLKREINSSLSGGELKRIEIATIVLTGNFNMRPVTNVAINFTNSTTIAKKMRLTKWHAGYQVLDREGCNKN